MARSELVYIAIFVVILAISTQQALALRCWACNSVNFPYCRDPFDPRNVTESEKFFGYVPCPGNRCIKTVTNITLTNQDNQIQTRVVSITRSCATSPESAELQCRDRSLSFCETCSTDGCNAGNLKKFDSIALMAIIPVLIAKLFANYIP